MGQADPNPYEPPSETPVSQRVVRANICPHCGKPAMSIFRKALIDRRKNVSCIECGRDVGVSEIRSLGVEVGPLILIFASLYVYEHSLWTTCEAIVAKLLGQLSRRNIDFKRATISG